MDEEQTLAQRARLADPLFVDAAIALALFALTLVEMSTTHCDCSSADTSLTVMFMALGTLPLVLRRRYPFTVMLVIGVSAIVYDVLQIPPDPYTAIFGIFLALYSVAAYGKRDRAFIALGILVVAEIVLNIPPISGHQDFRDVVTSAAILGGGWILGDSARARRRRDELLRERAERAERERAITAEKAALEERSRIAREIHDVVTHSVSVIAVQAGAARTVVEEHPEQAVEALRSIERISRETMAELRRSLGVLRDPAGAAELAPQPGLDALDDLVAQFGGTGLTVEAAVEGDPAPLPSGLDLAAYRVVQEALTNALRYAGPATARVVVRYRPETLEVSVADDGRGPPATNGNGPASGGQGLTGMRERVEAYGGTLLAGPGEGGGFEVRATFPLGEGDAADVGELVRPEGST
ncbi:MAG TPA: sensor histidine kinase [Actinomycetota bacterium]